ncbi:MAG: hypothetical protein H0W83_05240, partial [Planctomycetes bacterium]|nr:hypothetical protein [Planctomycetota bacterium]
MPESTSSPHVTVEEMQPRVDFASYWRVEAEQWYTYGVPSHHVLLVESGRLRARTPRGDVSAGPGDILCLRRELPNHYGYSGAVCYWETHLSFAPAPRTAWPLWLDGQPIPDVVALGSHAAAARSAYESLCLHLDRGGDLAQRREAGRPHLVEDDDEARDLRIFGGGVERVQDVAQ